MVIWCPEPGSNELFLPKVNYSHVPFTPTRSIIEKSCENAFTACPGWQIDDVRLWLSIVRQSKTLFIKKQSKTAPMHSVHTFISHTKLPLLVIPIGVRRLPAHTSGLLRLFCPQKASHVHHSRCCLPGHMKIRQTHLKHIRSHLPEPGPFKRVR